MFIPSSLIASPSPTRQNRRIWEPASSRAKAGAAPGFHPALPPPAAAEALPAPRRGHAGHLLQRHVQQHRELPAELAAEFEVLLPDRTRAHLGPAGRRADLL